MSFDDDRELAEAAQPLQDAVYRDILPVESITRYNKGEEDERHILDREHHIDIEVKLQNDSILLGQEKALRRRFASFNTFTIEFYQNRFTKEKGEFFHIGAQFYFHCYANANDPDSVDGLVKWRFIKLFDFIESLKNKPIEQLEEQTRSTRGSRASFFYIEYDEIPDEYVYAYKDEGTEPVYPSDGDDWRGSTLADVPTAAADQSRLADLSEFT